jgi:hypothetical protein
MGISAVRKPKMQFTHRAQKTPRDGRIRNFASKRMMSRSMSPTKGSAQDNSVAGFMNNGAMMRSSADADSHRPLGVYIVWPLDQTVIAVALRWTLDKNRGFRRFADELLLCPDCIHA